MANIESFNTQLSIGLLFKVGKLHSQVQSYSTAKISLHQGHLMLKNAEGLLFQFTAERCSIEAAPTYLPTYLPTHLLTYPPTYLLTYLTTYLPTDLPTYLHTYLPTYLPIKQGVEHLILNIKEKQVQVLLYNEKVLGKQVFNKSISQ